MAVAKEEKASDREIDHTVAIAMTVAATKLRNMADAGQAGAQNPEAEDTAGTDSAAVECQG